MPRAALPSFVLAATVVLALAAGASAQEDDPLVRAVREQEALRERQAQGIRRAEHQAFSPLTADPTVSPGLQGSGSSSPARIPAAAPKPPGVGVLPWAIGGVGVLMFALLGWFVLRRNRQ